MKIKLLQGNELLIERFFSLKTREDVANLLEIPLKVLIYYLYICKDQSKYIKKTIPKKSGGSRILSIPCNSLSIIQSKLSTILYLVYHPRCCVLGFVKGKCIRDNSQYHTNSSYVLNIDLSDFFPSINFGRVRGMFMAKPYSLNEEVSTVLAQICCFNNELPQGAPSSPVISNMICSRLDSELFRFARDKGIRYTRYADDLTFSTKRKNSSLELTNNNSYFNELKIIIESNGFKINEKKTKGFHENRRQEVTGLVSNRIANVKREYIRSIRGMIHAIGKYGPESACSEFLNKYAYKIYKNEKVDIYKVLWGRICFVWMIKGFDDNVFRNYYNRYCALVGNYERTLPRSEIERVARNVIVIETGTEQGTGFFLEKYGLITCSHVIKDDSNGIVGYFPGDDDKKYRLAVKTKNVNKDYALLSSQVKGLVELLKIGDDRAIKHGSRVVICGYPNYRKGNSIYHNSGSIVSTGYIEGNKYFICDKAIIAGNSGGPVLNEHGFVIGIAARGTKSIEEMEDESFYGIIPISVLNERQGL